MVQDGFHVIRVGFVLQPKGVSWIGGNNYYRNLLRALTEPPQLVDPIAFVGDLGDIPDDFPKIEAWPTQACRPRSKLWYLRQIIQTVVGRDWIFERTLRSASVDVLSHAGWLGWNASIPTICWIPDFQHLHYPEYFSPSELQSRDRAFLEQIDKATLVVVSSEVARRDLEHFAPHGAKKCRILHFADSSACEVPATAGSALQFKYKLPKRYFILPNQFWVHKNHSVVVEALGLLKKEGKSLTVVATGNPKDYRRPGHYEALMQRTRELGVEENFRPLGIVPYEDLAGLMRHAVAVINPSLFEGWSTTVEEVRALGKQSLLSSIPVHLEQSPPRAHFFDPHDAEDLSRQIVDIAEDFSLEKEQSWVDAAIKDTGPRRRAFAKAYHAIVAEAVQLGRRK